MIGQRLVRVLCEKCKEPVLPSPELRVKLERFTGRLSPRVERGPYKEITLYKPKGCAACGGLGFRGRIAIFELLEINDELKMNIASLTDEISIKKVAASQGMVTMQEDGILKALQGVTTFEEVEEATGPLVVINE